MVNFGVVKTSGDLEFKVLKRKKILLASEFDYQKYNIGRAEMDGIILTNTENHSKNTRKTKANGAVVIPMVVIIIVVIEHL